MNTYEHLEAEAYGDGIEIIQRNFNSPNIKGLYIDGNIAIREDMSTPEKTCVLAEELGHHYTTTGNILDQSDPGSRKQELHARLWGYNKTIGLRGIISAYQRHCRNLSEMAEYLEVTEPFLADCLDAYRRKYGCCVELDNYVIMFEPALAVIDRIG